MVRLEEALERYRKRRLTGEEAGELLGMSGRHFRRLVERYDEEGREGLRDRRLGKPSPRRAPEGELSRMRRLTRSLSRLHVKHFHEQLQKRHGYKLGYTVTRLALQAAGLARKAKRGGPHRKKRERRPLPGMPLFQDGSTHRWIAGFDRDLDLFRAFYTDRGSHYFHTPKAGGKVDKTKLTQVGRALQQLGVTGPGFDAAVEVDGIVKAGVSEKVDDHLTASAVMADDHQRSIGWQVIDARWDLRRAID